MDAFGRSFVFCSLLLSLATSVHPEEFVRLRPLTPNSHVTFGSGYEEDHLPIAECSSGPGLSRITCELHTHPSHKCTITIAGLHTHDAWIDEIHQFADDKLLIVYHNTVGPARNRTVVKTHDTNLCLTTGILYFESRPTVVAYARSFDVIFDGKIASYTHDGDELATGKRFAFDRPLLRVYPVSTRGHTKDLFVLSEHDAAATLHLVDHHGNLKKHLLHFARSHDFVSHSGHAIHTFCWNAVAAKDQAVHTAIECRQFNDFGVQKHEQHAELRGVNVLVDVRHSMDGGVVIFTVKDGAELRIVKLPENRKVSYPLVGHMNKLKITGFEESEGTFKLAYETISNDEHVVEFKKYELP